MSASVPSPGRLRAESVTLRYDQRVVSTGLSVDVPGDEFTVIIGPNACGKSTLLRSLSRLLRPAAGEVTLDGRSLASFKPKEFARTVGLLPQSSIAPEGIKAELGEVIAGTATGRSDDEQVTVFDTSGIAVQDLSASKIAYDRAVEAGLGTVVEL